MSKLQKYMKRVDRRMGEKDSKRGGPQGGRRRRNRRRREREKLRCRFQAVERNMSCIFNLCALHVHFDWFVWTALKQLALGLLASGKP